MNGAISRILPTALMLAWAAVQGSAQTGNKPSLPAETPGSSESSTANSMAGLNLLGSDVAMPPFADSLVNQDSPFRQSLLGEGMALRVITGGGYTQNLLAGPLAASDQAYVGQRPFENAMAQVILTADLRQFHLRKAQLYVAAVGNWVSWNPAGPKTLQLWALYVYKEFGDDRVEMKAGYVSNDLEFLGLQVGGSTATGAQGVYAVLPFEVGMSFFPLTAPSVNVRLRGPMDTYLKIAAQRSLDAAGGPATVARDHAGFRFIPKGDGLLLINEAGYRRPASAAAHALWLRAGYMHNSTPYANQVSGRMQPGNYCDYFLMDYQARQPDRLQPSHGLYVGVSAMTTPQELDPYSRYYELRVYQEAPFASRPGDVISFVASHTGYSPLLTDKLAAEGKTVWRSATSVTASYSIHVAPGAHVSLGLSYIHGPAITPRVANALTFTAGYTLFF